MNVCVCVCVCVGMCVCVCVSVTVATESTAVTQEWYDHSKLKFLTGAFCSVISQSVVSMYLFYKDSQKKINSIFKNVYVSFYQNILLHCIMEQII